MIVRAMCWHDWLEEGGAEERREFDPRATLSTPVTSSEAAAAIAALRAALPDVPSDAAMHRACVALVARLLGVAP